MSTNRPAPFLRPTLAPIFQRVETTAPAVAHSDELPPIDAMRSMARRMSPVEFLAAWPGHYLVVLRTLPAEEGINPYRTVEVQSVASGNSQRDVVGVLRVAKRPDVNPYASRISIGRARNNDVVISDLSVSKLHCWFVVKDDDARSGMMLCDSASRNGTFLNGARLGVAGVTVRSGSLLRFGDVEARLVDGLGLRAALAQDQIKAA